MTSMKEGTSAQLSGRGELHGGARVTTLVTLRKCTLGNKREIKTLKFASASTKGFKGGLAWIKPSKKDMAVTFSYCERRLQGSSSASPGKEKRSAGDKKRDRKWRDYQESLAAEAAQGAKGGTPAPSPQRTNGGHHPGSTTLGDYIRVARQTKAKPRQLLLKPQQASAGPSSDVESAHRGRMPADQASSSSSVAPDRDVARACERVCGVPCNLRLVRQRARQHDAAVEGAVGIAQEEAAEWAHGMAIHARSVAAIAAGLTAVAAHGAATAQVNGELAAADEEARLTQEAIACKEAEVRALEEALAQERAKKEAEERAHAEATAKAQADAAKKEAIEAARRKVAEDKAKTEAELAALEAQKARLQQAQEAEAARAREEAEARAAAATAAAMEEAGAKLRRETPPGDHEWGPFESFSKGTPPPG